MKNINNEFIDKAYNCLIKFQEDALQLRILQTPYLDQFSVALDLIVLIALSFGILAKAL